MRSSTGPLHFSRSQLCLLPAIVIVAFLAWPVHAQLPPQPGAPASDVSNIPKPATDTFDRIQTRDLPILRQAQESAEKDESCLLPPLTLLGSPTIAADQLRVPGKAKKGYHESCLALRHKRFADAEEHLRKAVQAYPKYSTAWVTLGQVLAAQQRPEEARAACAQASAADSGYVPAYLCLAELAARAHLWDEVLKLSNRALEIDAATDALAYEYNAAAYLNLNNLPAAEKSGLRALEADRDHHEPRVYFILAQIYEAKGDPLKEAAQLREFLRYAQQPEDIAAVEHVLTRLAKQASTESSPASTSIKNLVTTRRWGPADIDAVVPPVRGENPCPLGQILEQTSKHTQDLIENLQRFSANERIEQIDFDRNGNRRDSTFQDVDYVAQIETNSSGYPSIREYRAATGNGHETALMDTGAATFALIFHPSHLANFQFRCEGWTEFRGVTAWQLHFEEGTDPNQAFTAMRVGGALYLPRFKGRAWITTDTYNVIRIETDLTSPVSQIGLELEHLVIGYAPVQFQKRPIQLWLPENASLYIDYHGHRYQRVHSFSQFQLFSVDTDEKRNEPITKFAELR